MVFISRDELEGLRADNAIMKSELEEWRRMAPYLELGKELQGEIVETLGSTALHSMSVDQIGDIVTERVKSKHIDAAREKLYAEFEQTHRKALYERVVHNVREQEGESILVSVIQKVETDPILAKELHDSARAELTARAHDVVKSRITKEQEAVIETETERQIELDKPDVQFALEGELCLSDEHVSSLLRPEDKLVIMFEKHVEHGKTGLTLAWKEDINGSVGWVIGQPIGQHAQGHYYYGQFEPEVGKVPAKKYIRLGSLVPDLQKGENQVSYDILRCRYPLVLSWEDDKGNQKDFTVHTAIKRDGYQNSGEVILPIASSDFQTRDINFVDIKKAKVSKKK